MENRIRWTKSDYAKLRKSVSDFNKKLRTLQATENKIYMPDFASYQDIKSNIVSRRELNNTINSLKRFMREGAEDLYTTESGEVLTNWERKELSIQTRSITRRLEKELSELNKPGETGYSKAQMRKRSC